MREHNVSEDIPDFPEWLDRQKIPEGFVPGNYYDLEMWTCISNFVVIIYGEAIRYRDVVTCEDQYYGNNGMKLPEWQELDIPVEKFKEDPEKYIMELAL